MHTAAAEELTLCHVASVAEAATATRGDRLLNAEAYQRALWRHREDIVLLIQRDAEREALIKALVAALIPFARCADILAPGHNPVLFSIPTEAAAGRTYIQLRPADFRRAAALLEARG